MNFLKSLPKDRLQKLILIVILSLVGIGVICNFYIFKQLDELSVKKAQIEKLKEQIGAVQTEIKSEVGSTLMRDQLRTFLKAQEQRMVEGDSFSWMVREISLLAEQHPVHVGALSPGTKAAFLPKPNYDSYSTRLEVTGTYDQLGRFVSVLENTFPTGSLRNLTVAVLDATRGECRLNFELVLLVKPKSEAEPPPAAASDTGKDKAT